MPVLSAHLESGVLVRFVGPYRPDEDNPLLAFNEEKERGPVFRVERKSRDSIVLSPQADPEKWLRYPVRSGVVERFVVFEKVRDAIAQDAAEREKSIKEYKERFKDHIAAFDQRQLTPADQKEIEKMREIRQKLHEVRERKRQEKKDGDQRGGTGEQSPTGGPAG